MVHARPLDASAVARMLERHWRKPVMVSSVQALSAGAASETAAIDATVDGELKHLILQRAPVGGPVEGAKPSWASFKRCSTAKACRCLPCWRC
jgi:hypothetical protein